MDNAVDKCYLCLEEATERNQFIDPNPCNCKGTIKMHNSCAKELIENTDSCSICKTKWQYNGIKRTFYPNGRLKEVIHYVNAMQEGPYTSYRENGQLYIECNYIQNKIEGVYKEYYGTDVLYSDSTYINNKRQGLRKIYYPNGIIHEEIYYINDMQNGPFKIYDINGNLWEERYCVNDKYEGPLKIYYPNGNIHKEKEYKNGKYIGESKTYNEDGVLICAKKLGEYVIEYYLNGNVHREIIGNISVGTSIGDYWYADGDRMSVTDGIYKEYDEDGTLIDEKHNLNCKIIYKW